MAQHNEIFETLANLADLYHVELPLFEAANFGFISTQNGDVSHALAAIDALLNEKPSENYETVPMNSRLKETLLSFRDLVSSTAPIEHPYSSESDCQFIVLPWIDECREQRNMPFDWAKDWAGIDSTMEKMVLKGYTSIDEYHNIFVEIERDLEDWREENESNHQMSQLDYLKEIFTNSCIITDNIVREPVEFMLTA